MLNRKQCTLYQNNCSDDMELTTGVPQGSTLGPLLFLLYINDLPNVLLNGKCLLFADDTVIYLGRNCLDMVYGDIQHDLEAVYKWCNNNQITLNQSKTEYIHFSYRKKQFIPAHTLKLGNNAIKPTSSYKYLGTEIDSKLNVNAQDTSIIKKLALKKITFAKIRYLLTTEAAISLFRSCIQPLFDYNDFMYMLLAKDKCTKLQSMQYRILRIVFKGVNFSKNEMLLRVGVESLEVRRKVHLAGLMMSV